MIFIVIIVVSAWLTALVCVMAKAAENCFSEDVTYIKKVLWVFFVFITALSPALLIK